MTAWFKGELYQYHCLKFYRLLYLVLETYTLISMFVIEIYINLCHCIVIIVIVALNLHVWV